MVPQKVLPILSWQVTILIAKSLLLECRPLTYLPSCSLWAMRLLLTIPFLLWPAAVERLEILSLLIFSLLVWISIVILCFLAPKSPTNRSVLYELVVSRGQKVRSLK